MGDLDTDTLDPQVETQDPTVLEEAEANPNIEVNPEEVVEAPEVDDKGKKVWYDQLPSDMQSDPNIQKYKSLDQYVKGNRELVKMIGKDKLVAPTDKSSQEEIDAFYNKLGRPEEATAYSTPTEESVPEAIRMADGAVDTFKLKAHELGLTQAQYEGLFEMQMEINKDRYEAELSKAEDLGKTTETALRKEYGATYDAKVETAQNVINKYFGKEKMHPAFSVLANDKGFVKAMSAIGEGLGEDTIKGEAKGSMTPSEAQSEMNKIITNEHPMSKAYYDDLNPEHNVVVDHVLSLQKMIQAGE